MPIGELLATTLLDFDAGVVAKSGLRFADLALPGV